MNTDKRSLDEISLEVFQLRRIVNDGAIWRHLRSGGRYEIVGIFVNEKSQKPMIGYRSVSNSLAVTWVRPAKEFLDGRFVLVDDGD